MGSCCRMDRIRCLFGRSQPETPCPAIIAIQSRGGGPFEEARNTSQVMMNRCANGCHARFVYELCPSVVPINAAVIVGIGREWDRTPSPKFVQPGCTATTNRIQVNEMLLHEGGEAYKKVGPKFMRCLVAKQKVLVTSKTDNSATRRKPLRLTNKLTVINKIAVCP